ncbi:hypothetical protein ACLB2K_007702 [Fragaria x ananassa]
MFRRFHVSAPKDGKPEHWKSEKAKNLYEVLKHGKTLGLEREEEFGQVKHKVETLMDEVVDLKQLIQVLLARESAFSLGPSDSLTTVPNSKSAHGDYEARAT